MANHKRNSSREYCFTSRPAFNENRFKLSHWFTLALILLGVLLISSQTDVSLILAGIVLVQAGIGIQLARLMGKRNIFHDVQSNTLIIRSGLKWRISSGFKITRIPAHVGGNPGRFLRAFYKHDGISMHVLVTLNQHEGKTKFQAGGWFETARMQVQEIPRNKARYCFMIVFQKKVSLLHGIKRQLEDFDGEMEVIENGLMVALAHHKLVPLNKKDLAFAWYRVGK